MAVTIRRATIAIALIAAIAALAYLRDPPWLLSMASGFHHWETGSDGKEFRWMGGHASFFVPSTVRAVELPVRTTFDRDWPIALSVAIDDRPGDRIVLDDGEWHTLLLRLPPPGRRKTRRIDIRLDRMRDESHGAMIGEPIFR